jgi:hypothetical protein
MPLARQLMQNPRLRVHVVKDHAVRNQVVIFNTLPLFRTIIRGDDPFAAKEQPLNTAIEGFTFVRCRLNRLAKFYIAQIPQ